MNLFLFTLFLIKKIITTLDHQLAKYTSYMYKCLSTEEKQRWEAHASQDKARYEAEMTTYGEFCVEWINYVLYFCSSCLICHASY